MSEPIDLAKWREAHIELIGERKPLWDRGPCEHPYHIVDTTLRRVTCKDCGEVLDPIEVICQYVDHWRRMRDELEILQKLKREQRDHERQKDMNRMARRVAHHGGIWACDVKTRHMYWDGG